MKFIRLSIALTTFVVLLHLSAKSQMSCDVTIPLTQSIIEGASYQPGTVVCLAPGTRDYLLFKDLNGTAAQPIVITSDGGLSKIDTDHYYGIKFSGCNHVLLSGAGTKASYGIKINRVGNGAGITIDNLSSDVEVEFVEIGHTLIGGIYAKTDPSCDNFSSTRDKFTMYNIIIHDCYLHDIGDEGFYIGSSKFTGQYLSSCDTTVLPHIIEGVEIYNNIVENTGWDGIQVSSTPLGCKIFGNTVRYDSQRETTYQMSGILIGGGSVCDCYNNKVIDGKGDGIDVFGSNNMWIYNNLIVRAGRTFMPNDQSQLKHGIFIGSAPDQSAASLKILHNTIISPKTSGIRFMNNNTFDNKFINNIILDPGSYPTLAEKAFLDASIDISLYEYADNFLSTQISSALFVQAASDNYSLKPSSPAINKAQASAISFDIDNAPRPHNQGADIGAYECQDTYAGTGDLASGEVFELTLAPNPTSTAMVISLQHPVVASELKLVLLNVQGRITDLSDRLTVGPESHQLTVNLLQIPVGVYLLECVNGKRVSRGKVIISK
ncbi:MAG: right-handed parallel beta-helix repeat-containing protein [Bacteroidales bacterium]|nr:right-handed parallel beta-helix repeat-containing protein [Bacteroidales bacterium]